MLAVISAQWIHPHSLPGRVRAWFVSVQKVPAFFLHNSCMFPLLSSFERKVFVQQMQSVYVDP